MSREGLLPYLDADSKSDLNSQLIPRSPDTQTGASPCLQEAQSHNPRSKHCDLQWAVSTGDTFPGGVVGT